MKIKLLVDVDGAVKDSIVDCDDVKGKELIDGKKAVQYTDEMLKADENAIKEKIQNEVTKTSEDKVMPEIKETVVEVTKNQPVWKSMGEFLGAVIQAGKDGQVDPRLTQKSTGQSEVAPGTDGGYTVTTDIASFITQQAQAASVMAQKCSKMEIGNLYTGIKIPQVNEVNRNQTTLYGGVRCYSPAEGIAKTPFKQAYTQKDIQLKKICAVNYITDELLQDNTALESFIRMNVGRAFAWTLDNEIINGTLTACTAIVNNAATAEQTFAGAAPTPAELTLMFSRNMNRSRAEWYLSGNQYATILSLATTGTFPLFQPNFAVAPMGTLFGRPINVIEQAGITTDESSFMFLDLSDYLLIGKGGIVEATSIHVKFLEDETAFRWTMRVGGAPLMASTVTMPDGLVYSSFITRD